MKGHYPSGHVHVFQGYGGGMGDSADKFWNDEKQLEKYRIVRLFVRRRRGQGEQKWQQPGARGSMFEYLNAGGRAFATHYHYIWFKESPQDELRQVADFSGGSSTDGEFDLNMSFPKGQMLAMWLKATDASSSVGKSTLRDVTALDEEGQPPEGQPPATTWIESVKPNSEPKFISFNTPVSAEPEAQCGRACSPICTSPTRPVRSRSASAASRAAASTASRRRSSSSSSICPRACSVAPIPPK